jgi:hypothetical protein
MTRWLAAARRLRPIPALVAGVRAGSERTVENQLLELATAAEGLHRRMFPDQRVLDAEDAERIRATINQAKGLTHRLKEIALSARPSSASPVSPGGSRIFWT